MKDVLSFAERVTGLRTAVQQQRSKIVAARLPTPELHPADVAKHGTSAHSVRYPGGMPTRAQEGPTRLIIQTPNVAPGDLLMLTGAIRDLHACYPGKYLVDIKTPYQALLENNPGVCTLDPTVPGTMELTAFYGQVSRSNDSTSHYATAFHEWLGATLRIPIHQTEPWGAVYLSEAEKAEPPLVWSRLSGPRAYWVLNAGYKPDATVKFPGHAFWQHVVDICPEVLFVQTGAGTSKAERQFHPPVKGDNVLDLRGQTTLRDMVTIMYNAVGCLTPVSFPMHLAAAVPMNPVYCRPRRPCVVVAGGREPSAWEAYSTHRYLTTGGMYPCCAKGGCWAYRTVALDDGRSENEAKLCRYPVQDEEGVEIPFCMSQIDPITVQQAIRNYLCFYDYDGVDTNKWHIRQLPDLRDLPSAFLPRLQGQPAPERVT